MRTLVAALLLACSAAHAGSFTVAMVNPKLSLVDLDTTDSASPSITVAPGGNLADWSTPFSFGGEFWTDYNNVTPLPVIQLQGILGAHSGLQWTGSLVIDTQLISTKERDEYFDLFGGAGGYIATGLISSFELLPIAKHERRFSQNNPAAAFKTLSHDTLHILTPHRADNFARSPHPCLAAVQSASQCSRCTNTRHGDCKLFGALLMQRYRMQRIDSVRRDTTRPSDTEGTMRRNVPQPQGSSSLGHVLMIERQNGAVWSSVPCSEGASTNSRLSPFLL